MSDPVGAPARGAAGAPALLEARGLRKAFGDHEVLRGIDVSAASGTVTVLIGPSGSGKTTALRCLNALEIPEAGVVRVADCEVDFSAPVDKRLVRRLRTQSGMVFQSHHLFPHMTVV